MEIWKSFPAVASFCVNYTNDVKPKWQIIDVDGWNLWICCLIYICIYILCMFRVGNNIFINDCEEISILPKSDTEHRHKASGNHVEF